MSNQHNSVKAHNDGTTVLKLTNGDALELNDVKCDEKCKDELKETEHEYLMYGVDEIPSWQLTILLGFQITITNLSSFLVIATIISEKICADLDFKSRIFQSSALLTGVTSIAQALIGVRLPIFQGPAVAGILPFMDAASDPRWRCNASQIHIDMSHLNSTNQPIEKNWDEQWKHIQGSMLIGSIFMTVVGMSGLAALISKIIRPISISVLFLLLGVYVWKMIADLAAVHWGIATLSLVVVIICSQFISLFNVPFPSYSRSQGCGITRLPIFQLFSVFIAILISWFFCYIFTATGVFSSDATGSGYYARTDIYQSDISAAPFIRLPYPGQFGVVKFDLNYSIFYIPIMITLIIDAVADFHQTAYVSCVPAPPRHAINRGIAIMGIGAILSSFFGAGHPTSSYGNMMGIIKITRVASRAASVVGGIISIFLAIFGKFGAVLVSIPKPVLFGPAFLSISFLMGTAFENLKHVNLGSHRNQATLGMSMFFGCVLPFWIAENKDALNSGSPLADDIIIGVLRIPFLMGVLAAVLLDSILPGKRDKLPEEIVAETTDVDLNGVRQKRRIQIYKFPFISHTSCYNIKWLPFMPSFTKKDIV